MNENNNYLEREEIEIDLGHMMIYILKQWKKLILVVLMGAIVGGSVFMLKQLKPVETDNEIEEYVVKPETEESMKVAYQYRQLYENQMEYSNHSFLMKMDANEVYIGESKYHISAGSDTEYITLLFQNLINSEEVLKDIKEAGGLEEKEQYVKEILSCSTNRGADSYVDDLVEEAIGTSSYIAKTAVINYKIIYSDKDACEAMLEVLHNAVKQLDSTCKEKYRVYKLQEIYSSVSKSVDNSIAQKQGENISSLNSYLTTVKSLESGFTGEDLLYYQTKYLEQNVISDEEAETPTETRMENPIKGVVISILFALVIGVGYYSIKYLTDGSIKTADEIRTGFRLPIIGCIEEEDTSKNCLDKWIGKIKRKRNGNGDSLDYISSLLKTEEGAFLCINRDDEVQKVAALSLQKKCPGIEIGNMIYRDGTSLEKARKAQRIILFIHLEYTNRNELRRVMEICRQQQLHISGVVILDR